MFCKGEMRMEELKLGIVKSKELAEWFQISASTYYNQKSKKLKELEQYCKFEDLGKKGVNILEIYNAYYQTKARQKVKQIFDELFKEVYGADCTAIFSYLNSNNEQFTDITLAILGKVDDILNYRYKASAYSKTDEALSKLLDAITEKVDEIDDIITVDNVNKLVALSENLSSGSLSQEGIVNTIRTLNKEDKKITVSGSKDGE